MKKLIFAMVLTVLWFFGIVWYGCAHLDAFGALKPNEIGDFLAGVTSPVAFLWLIIGYLLQGESIRSNTEAIQKQEESVRQMIELDEQKIRQIGDIGSKILHS